MKKLFTSESVTEGHPDKMADIIADRLLDAYLEKDENARVACEVCISAEQVLIMGEVSSVATIDIEKITRDTIIEIGYNNDELGFNGYKIPININLHQQSNDISIGVNKDNIGAGDQGMMFGYATCETDNYMPYALNYAHVLSRRLTEVRKKGIIPYLRPDGKTQVTIIMEDNKLLGIDNIIVSAQHDDISIDKLRYDIKKYVIEPVIPKNLINNDTKFYINSTGRFVIGGPVGDSGLTGRKIIVDTYGGVVPHGGGAFSGKDYTKVDRTGAYYARYVCKNIVASGLCKRLSLQVSYAIGISKPLAIYIDTFNTNNVDEGLIMKIINDVFSFIPSNMIYELNLKRPIYHLTTAYGHFGKNDLPYEKLDKVEKIKKTLLKYQSNY